MTKKARIFNDILLFFGILCLVYYIGMGLAVRFGQSLLFLWPVVGLFCIGRWALYRRAFREGRHSPFPRWFYMPVRIVICLFLAFFFLVEGYIFSCAAAKAPADLDAVIVLGARVNSDGPSGSLRERASAAAEYLRQNPDTLCIVSGGQGKDEPMSEAGCIRDILIEGGIDSGRIIAEEESTDTIENLTNSFALLPEEARNIGIITNDFHVCRALFIGRQLSDYSLSGVSARSSVFGFIHYAAREFCGLVVSWITGELPFAAFFTV